MLYSRAFHLPRIRIGCSLRLGRQIVIMDIVACESKFGYEFIGNIRCFVDDHGLPDMFI